MVKDHVLLKMDRETLLAKAEEIGRLEEAEANEADKNAFLSDQVCQAMKEAEFHKLLKPKRYGGYSVELKPYTEMIRTVSRYSMAAGWLAYFYSAHEVWPAYLPPKGRDLVLGGDTLLADVVAPIGRAEKDGEGFRLYGQWNFCSGVLSADWIGLGAMAELTQGEGPEYCLFVLPKSDVIIVHNWDTIGLRGSGSNGVLVEGAFVPSYMIVPAKNLFATGIPVGSDYDENDPVYRMPFKCVYVCVS